MKLLFTVFLLIPFGAFGLDLIEPPSLQQEVAAGKLPPVPSSAGKH